MEDPGKAQDIELSDYHGFILTEELISLTLVMDAFIFSPLQPCLGEINHALLLKSAMTLPEGDIQEDGAEAPHDLCICTSKRRTTLKAQHATREEELGATRKNLLSFLIHTSVSLEVMCGSRFLTVWNSGKRNLKVHQTYFISVNIIRRLDKYIFHYLLYATNKIKSLLYYDSLIEICA